MPADLDLSRMIESCEAVKPLLLFIMSGLCIWDSSVPGRRSPAETLCPVSQRRVTQYCREFVHMVTGVQYMFIAPWAKVQDTTRDCVARLEVSRLVVDWSGIIIFGKKQHSELG